LSTGDQYRLAFVTSSTTTAESTDIESYNSFVQSVADAAPIGAWGLEWKAIGTTKEVNARQNTETDPVSDMSVPVFRLDGEQLSPSYEQFWDLTGRAVEKPFHINEFGEVLVRAGDQVSLGLDVAWTGSNNHGLNFGEVRALGNGRSWVGYPFDASPAWFYDDISYRQQFNFPMYAISEVLTVPEPQLGICFVLVFFFLFQQLRTRKRY